MDSPPVSGTEVFYFVDYVLELGPNGVIVNLTTGTATLRKRRLPAEQVVWLVIGMALLRDRPIAEVVRQLDLAMPSADGRRTVASSDALATPIRL